MQETIQYISDKASNLEIIIQQDSQKSYVWHNHTSIYTLGIILSGTIELTLDDQKIKVGSNQIFFIPPYMPHSIEAIQRYTMLSVCIKQRQFNDLEIEFIKNRLMMVLETPCSIRLTNEQMMILYHPLENLVKITDEEWEMVAIERVIKQIEYEPEKELSIEEMAQRALMSKYHFIRCFKKRVGLTPHQFQIQNRVRKAQHLLGKEENTTEVALTTGFYDQSHFIRCFEKIVGLTPTDYQKVYRQI